MYVPIGGKRIRMNCELSIFTPVYNRAEKLQVLYRSLLTQTDQRFEWIIVDDGSRDETPKVISDIVSEQKLHIKTRTQINQGKHVAHNEAVKMCTTEWCVCVDSDDSLVPTAVEEIIQFIGTNHNNIGTNIAGIIAWKGFSPKNKIGKLPISTYVSSLSELYRERGMTGDTMLVFRTDIIRKFPFPAFEGERFLRESIIYNKIDEEYQYLILDRILYLADYYEDGLSKNASKLELKSPNGAALFRWDEFKHSTTLKTKIRNLISYVFFNRIAHNNKESLKRLGVLFAPFWILSWSGYIHYRKYL